jgi:hypothetical protein
MELERENVQLEKEKERLQTHLKKLKVRGAPMRSSPTKAQQLRRGCFGGGAGGDIPLGMESVKREMRITTEVTGLPSEERGQRHHQHQQQQGLATAKVRRLSRNPSEIGCKASF